MKSKDNIGEVSELDLEGPWSLSPNEKTLIGDEFDSATSEIESFFEGLKYSFDHCEFVVIGNFFGERTHHVIIRGLKLEENDQLSDILKIWLSAPRRKNWRIVLDFEYNDNIDAGRSIIYFSKYFRINN